VTTAISEADLLARRLPLSGTFNVRDVGGYATTDGRQVKWKTLLRGDALHDLDDEGRAFLAAYGVQTSIDLREEDERSSAPDRVGGDVRIVNVPMFSFGASDATGDEGVIDRASLTSLEDTYRLLVHTRGPALVAAIRHLADPVALPAIVHCSAGKDRTGVVIALALAAVGVPDEVIAADFAATSLFLNDEFRTALRARSGTVGRDEVVMARMLSCEPALILGILDEIRTKYGDIDVYLVQHGLATEELGTLRALLLTDAAPDEPTTVDRNPHA